jgi:hypothetical protein
VVLTLPGETRPEILDRQLMLRFVYHQAGCHLAFAGVGRGPISTSPREGETARRRGLEGDSTSRVAQGPRGGRRLVEVSFLFDIIYLIGGIAVVPR